MTMDWLTWESEERARLHNPKVSLIPKFMTPPSDSAPMCDEINRAIIEDVNRRRLQYLGACKEETMELKDLEKELSKMGIKITRMRNEAGSRIWDIEGYLNPDTYHKYTSRSESLHIKSKTFKPVPKKVIFSGPATTILWLDGTKTTVKCQSEDVWDDDVGIAMCYLKKMLGNKGNFNNIFREAMKVAEVQQHTKEKIISSKTLEDDAYYGSVSYFDSAINNMKQNISEINNAMKDAADAINKALEGKNDN